MIVFYIVYSHVSIINATVVDHTIIEVGLTSLLYNAWAEIGR